jgi:hypothetical protein
MPCSPTRPASLGSTPACSTTTRAACRAHLAEATLAGGYATFDRKAAHAAVSFLTSSARTILRPGQLAGILVEELRRRRVLLPTPLVLEAVIRGARERAERLAQEVLTSGLDEATLARLDALLDPRPAGKLTWIGWLRNAPQSARAEERAQAHRTGASLARRRDRPRAGVRERADPAACRQATRRSQGADPQTEQLRDDGGLWATDRFRTCRCANPTLPINIRKK